MADQAYSRWRPHPWHGLPAGPTPPETVTAFIEITPFDLVKYEVDKASGYLRVDRPQRTSSTPPTLYGFVPRTYCGARVAKLSPRATKGDGDPLDICVLSERPVERAEVLLTAHVVGGIRMVDNGEADDKIIAVLEGDALWCDAREIDAIPSTIVERLRHYFATYKLELGQAPTVVVDPPYGRAHAVEVVRAALADYDESFGKLAT